MSNLPTIANFTLPAHLAAAIKSGQKLVSSQVAVGLSSGGAIRLVANQGRFRIKDGSAETVLQDLFLDTIIVGGVPGYTKLFYAKPFVPGADNAEEPDCASLLGDAPDTGVKSPQSASCASCPKNQWGSKISPTGSEIKACSDYRRLAIIASDDPDTVYQANIPPASIKALGKYVKELDMRGLDLSMVITRISLKEHEWQFTFAGPVSEEQYNAVLELAGSPKVQTVLGLTGRTAIAALPAPAAEAPAPAAPAAPAPAPAPAAEAPAAPAEAAPAKGFGKRGRTAAAAPAAAPAAPAAVVAPANAGLEALANELGNLIGGAPTV